MAKLLSLSMPNWQMSLSKLQEKIWHGRLPLEIRLAPSECRTYDVCDPYLRLFRRFVPQLGPVDISPILAVIVLLGIQRGLDALLSRVH